MYASEILFNRWKHHAGFLREQIALAVPLDELARELVVVGGELMDLYTGQMSPDEIAAGVLATLTTLGIVSVDAYRRWIADNLGWRAATLDADGSIWTLRIGDDTDRFIHIHPGRRSPHTVRVRANVLKTAVMVLAYVRLHGGDVMDVNLVNAVRTEFLNLSPMREVLADAGLGPILRLLQSS